MGTRSKRIVLRKALGYWIMGAVGCVMLFPLFYLLAPGTLGSLEARYDLWRGRYAVYTLGLPAPGTVLIAKSLEQEGIEWG